MRTTRRDLFRSAGIAAIGATATIADGAATPWRERCYRWAHAGIGGTDAFLDDPAWWRAQWKRDAVQGVVIDADALEAYYPTRLPLHRQAQFLKGRDAFGGLIEAARRDGLAVLASVDSSAIGEEVLKAHPDWVARAADGSPVRAGKGYAPCVHSAYVQDYLHAILRELIGRYRPEGISGVAWEGLSRDTVCQCQTCARRFREQTGKALPKNANWNDPDYREWIRWNYARRLELWDLNNKVTKAAGGQDCLWIGSVAASAASQSGSFRATREIAARAPLLFVDNLSRQDGGDFWQNPEQGRYLNGLMGWNKVVVESTAMFQRGGTGFSRVSASPAEVRLWMLSGIGGGFHPNTDYAAAGSEDPRIYQTAGPIVEWHRKNQRYLVNRTPVAAIGVVWSQASYDFYGRGAAGVLAENPYRGILRALYRNRIPCLPIAIEDLEREAERLTALVLPNVASMTDKQCAVVSRFVERGGGLLATGVTSLYDSDGEPRADFGLAPVLGVHLQGPPPDRMYATNPPADSGDAPGRGRRILGFGGRGTIHTYLRLQPEMRASVFGPHIAGEPPVAGSRHPVLAGFEATDVVPFGSSLVPFRVDADRSVLCTFVPPFPQLPTDAVWMQQERTDTAGLSVGAFGKGRVAFLAADLDRRYGADPIPDHGRLLGNLLRWIGLGNPPVTVEGTGTIGLYLYRQENRLILHIVNATGADNQKSPIEEYTPVGPFQVTVRLPEGVKARSVKLLAAEKPVAFKAEQTIAFEIPQIADHEVVVIE